MKHLKHLPESNHLPILRIAPVCNGKIYVTPRPSSDEKNPCMDIPMEESMEQVSAKSDKAACKVKEKYHLHLQTKASPRFCVQHRSASANEGIVFLYVLPLKEEKEISFHEGEWVTSDDIAASPEAYSLNLQLESELLGMAAELWNDYYSSGI